MGSPQVIALKWGTPLSLATIWRIISLTWKRCKIGRKLVLIINRKAYIGFRLVPKSVTLNDLERRNGHYIALFHCIWWTYPTRRPNRRVDLWRNLCTSLLYFVVRARCRRKESSRSLSPDEFLVIIFDTNIPHIIWQQRMTA